MPCNVITDATRCWHHAAAVVFLDWRAWEKLAAHSYWIIYDFYILAYILKIRGQHQIGVKLFPQNSFFHQSSACVRWYMWVCLCVSVSPQGQPTSETAPQRTPGSSGQLGRWPGVSGSLWSSASSRSASASSRSLSSAAPHGTGACTPQGLLDTAAQHTHNLSKNVRNQTLYLSDTKQSAWCLISPEVYNNGVTI